MANVNLTIKKQPDISLTIKTQPNITLKLASRVPTDWSEISNKPENIEDISEALDSKVDKVVGKQLTTEDFTTTLKSKLDGIETGAEKNVNPDWNAVSGDAQILNKPVLYNDLNARQAISENITGIDYNNTTGVLSLTTGYIIPTQTTLDNKVDKETGKALSSNNFTDALKLKLDGIESGAQVNDVFSVNSQVGAIVLDTDDISEGTTNRYFSNTLSRQSISENIEGIDYSNTTGVLSLTTGYIIPTLTSFNNKVDKEVGKVLSENDFTDADKSKLDSIETGGLLYKGGWDASTGDYPTNPENSNYWIITVAGTINSILYSVGDQIIYSSIDGWSKLSTGGAQDSEVVHNTGDETIHGNKTFDDTLYITDKLNVGSTSFDLTNPEFLKVDGGTSASVNIISGYGDYDDYVQLNIKNRNTGTSSSSDIVATADIGQEGANYIDFGINGSNYDVPEFNIVEALDGYAFVDGGHFAIGTASPAKTLKFFTGGTLSSDLRATLSDTLFDLDVNISALNLSGTNSGDETNSTIVSKLGTDLSNKALDSSVVHLAGIESITGIKTFTSPIYQTTISGQEIATTNSELLSAGDTWNLGSGWSGNFATGFTHTSGSGTAVLSDSTVVPTVGYMYILTLTVTGRTTGGYYVSFGGDSNDNYYSGTISRGYKATTTDILTITPDSTFNGTIVASLKRVTATNSSPSFQITDSESSTSFQINPSKGSLSNVYIGVGAGRYGISASSNIAIGKNALASNISASMCIAIGEGALQNHINGRQCVAVGTNAMFNNTTGSRNFALGFFSMYNNTTGSSNVAIGVDALESNTTGSGSIAIGSGASALGTTGASNTSIGGNAGYNNITGNYNTCIGNGSGYYNTSDASTFVGYYAGYGSTGGNSTIIGYQSASSVTSGSVTALGAGAGRYITDGTTFLTSAPNSIFIGAGTRALNNIGSNEIVIGTSAIGNGSNTVTIGNSSITNTYLKGNVSTSGTITGSNLSGTNTGDQDLSTYATKNEVADFESFAIAMAIAL